MSSGKISPTSALPSHAGKPLLDIDAVTVTLGGEDAIQSISLCVHAGEFIGLIGPNGAGKTTLIRTLLGLTTPTAGTVKRTSTSVIGYVPQRGNLYNAQIPISVLEVVQLGAYGNRAVALKALEAVAMQDFAHKPFTELSGGQQQRVAIAKALASDPDILLLDEPTTGIDEQAQRVFYELLRSLQQEGLTIIIVSHDIDTVLNLVTRVICLNRTLLYDGPPENFEANKYMPQTYQEQHRILHHHHGEHHA